MTGTGTTGAVELLMSKTGGGVGMMGVGTGVGVDVLVAWGTGVTIVGGGGDVGSAGVDVPGTRVAGG